MIATMDGCESALSALSCEAPSAKCCCSYRSIALIGVGLERSKSRVSILLSGGEPGVVRLRLRRSLYASLTRALLFSPQRDLSAG